MCICLSLSTDGRRHGIPIMTRKNTENGNVCSTNTSAGFRSCTEHMLCEYPNMIIAVFRNDVVIRRLDTNSSTGTSTIGRCCYHKFNVLWTREGKCNSPRARGGSRMTPHVLYFLVYCFLRYIILVTLHTL